jgi:hypothetical protein
MLRVALTTLGADGIRCVNMKIDRLAGLAKADRHGWPSPVQRFGLAAAHRPEPRKADDGIYELVQHYLVADREL